MLCACTNQVDDVLVPSNILHRVHFRQEVSQLVLSSIGWKIRQIIDFTPCIAGQPRSKVLCESVVDSITAFIKLFFFCYCSTQLVRLLVHYLVSLCGTEPFGYPVPNGGGISENNRFKLRCIFLIGRQHGVISTGIKNGRIIACLLRIIQHRTCNACRTTLKNFTWGKL